jgi:hypothetical protein
MTRSGRYRWPTAEQALAYRSDLARGPPTRPVTQRDPDFEPGVVAYHRLSAIGVMSRGIGD